MTDSKESKYNFDRLKMYFGDPYLVKSSSYELKILQPTVGDILSCGEKEFYSMLYTFIGNPTTYRLQLWDMGKDWNTMDDFELFCLLYKTADVEITKYLFGDFSFQSFDTYQMPVNDGVIDEKNKKNLILYDPETGKEFTSQMYEEIRTYLRIMFDTHPKVEKAKGKTTKQWMIEEERQKLALDKDKDISSSTLLPLVSFCVNHPGFQYKTNELRELGIVQFMDSVQRLQIYENTRALNSGLYCGMADLSKVPKDQFNFMREVSVK